MVRKLAWLGVTCMSLGALCSGVKGGGVAVGALAGVLIFGVVVVVSVLIGSNVADS